MTTHFIPTTDTERALALQLLTLATDKARRQFFPAGDAFVAVSSAGEIEPGVWAITCRVDAASRPFSPTNILADDPGSFEGRVSIQRLDALDWDLNILYSNDTVTSPVNRMDVFLAEAAGIPLSTFARA